MKGRASGRIEVEEWRTLLRDELECADVGLRKSIEDIMEEAISYPKSIVLYQGIVKLFKNYMETEGFTVEAVYLQHYWRSPLEVLRVIAWTKGIDKISNDAIAKLASECRISKLQAC